MNTIRQIRKMSFAYLLILPTAAYLLIFQLYPLFESIRLSFTNIHLVKKNWSYIGFDNYMYLFLEDEYFWPILRNSILWIFGSLIGQVLMAFAVALLLNRKILGNGLWRGLSMVPWMMPVVVVGLMWKFLFDYNYGLINHYLINLGLISKSILWFSDPVWVWPSLLISATWKGFGYLTIMILAGLKGISKEVFESSAIDGATGIRKFWFITLPLLRPVLLVAIVVQIITGWTKFEMIWVLTNGGPGYATSILPTYVYTNSFDNFRMGLGSSVAVLSTLIIAILLIFYYQLVSKRE